MAEKTFSQKVAIITSEQNVDNFSPTEWKKLLNENQIFIMTAQCFHDGVVKSFIKLEQANVIIFDECHHGREGHVMHQIMQAFEGKDMSRCRVIGLSGMLIGVSNKTNSETVSHEMRQLEATFQSTIITVNDLNDQKNSLLHSTKAKEFRIKFSMPIIVDCVIGVCINMTNLIEKIVPIKLKNVRTQNPKTLREDIPGNIKDLTKLFKDVQYQAEHLGAYGVYLTLLSVLIQLELIKRYGTTEKFRSILDVCITEVERNIQKMKTELQINTKNVETICKNSSEKVKKLILGLKEMFMDKNREKDLQCLVFTKRRSTAKALYHTLKYYVDYSNDASFDLKPDFVVSLIKFFAIILIIQRLLQVGQNNKLPNEIECIISQSYNMKALEKFSNKETNCIFCTDVLEEGIDLQLCNAVIMFDHPETFRSYMQSRGRARDDESKYIIMIDVGKVIDFDKNTIKWKHIDVTMKKELIGKTLDRDSPTVTEIIDQQAQAWTPFVTANGSQLKALNAIIILNQYAQALASDRYSNNIIEWRRIDVESGAVCVGIRLPPVISKEIIGDVQNDIKTAKQHAAFKVCIELYKIGELTENLTPFNGDQKIALVQDDYFAHWKKYETDDKKKAGTKKNMRFHEMKIPNALVHSSPVVGGINFLYRISVRPKFDANKEVPYLEAFKNLLENKNSYGILMSKRLPKLCKMPLFPSWGEVECEIETPPMQFAIKSEEDLRMLRKFQVTVFRDVLDSWRNYFVIDKDSYIVVPLDDDQQIDWNIVKEFQTLSTTPMSLNESLTVKFRAHDYLNKIITPTYRDAGNYIVYKICEDKSPLSPFPEEFETYKDYYLNKYNLLARDDQFLLECKAISKNINFFFPGKPLFPIILIELTKHFNK